MKAAIHATVDPAVLAALHQGARSRAREAAAKLALPMRHGLRLSSGNIPGSNAGSSIDFQDHRPYVPGDDPRHIDWQAYARSGHYTMKLYREEVRPMVDIAIDGSRSMTFPEIKATRSLELAYFCAESALAGAGALRVFLLNGERVSACDPKGNFALFEGSENPDGPPGWGRVPWRAGSLRILVSDLLHHARPSLGSMLTSGGSALLLAPYCRDEENPDWLGNVELVDCENGARRDHDFRPEDLKRYGKAYQQHFANWELEARRHGAPFARIPSEPGLLEALASNALPTGAVSLAACPGWRSLCT